MDKKTVLMALNEYMNNGPYAHRGDAMDAFIETMAELIEDKQKKKSKVDWKVHWMIAIGIGVAVLMISLVVKGL